MIIQILNGLSKIDAPIVYLSSTYVLLGERVDKLGKDLVGDNSLSELVRVVGETSEGQSGGLLDGRDVVKEKRSEESHNAYFKRK